MIVVTGSESFVGKELITQCKKNAINLIEFDLIEKKRVRLRIS